ncbi:hypothetical protein C8J56DRAFT_972104 [Mycena floridula]|nr:hypothetical protein C8J56DRAFT_972104 [Mycena floridula]
MSTTAFKGIRYVFVDSRDSSFQTRSGLSFAVQLIGTLSKFPGFLSLFVPAITQERVEFLGPSEMKNALCSLRILFAEEVILNIGTPAPGLRSKAPQIYIHRSLVNAVNVDSPPESLDAFSLVDMMSTILHETFKWVALSQGKVIPGGTDIFVGIWGGSPKFFYPKETSGSDFWDPRKASTFGVEHVNNRMFDDFDFGAPPGDSPASSSPTTECRIFGEGRDAVRQTLLRTFTNVVAGRHKALPLIPIRNLPLKEASPYKDLKGRPCTHPTGEAY